MPPGSIAKDVPILSARGLTQVVPTAEGDLEILAGLDLTLARGETLAIVGESGAGKSTLLGLLAGLDLPSGGEVHLDGVALGDLDEDGRARLRGRLLGFVFQSFQLIPGLNVLENVMLPLELAGKTGAQVAAREILGRVGLGRRLHHYPRQISGGEQQRVALARAFVGRPALLMADEPTGNLDRRTGARVADLLFELNRERGATLVLVTHDRALAGRCARVLRMEAGRWLGEGIP